MPLHDAECLSCGCVSEELHGQGECVLCPCCGGPTKLLVGRLADYTGQNTLTVQYATRNSKVARDSHLQKLPTHFGRVDPSPFLRRRITTQRVN
jgi:hypothetical protein